MFKYIINRLKESSTWLGIIGLVTACGATISTILPTTHITSSTRMAILNPYSRSLKREPESRRIEEIQYEFLKDTERMVAMWGGLYKPYSQVNELA